MKCTIWWKSSSDKNLNSPPVGYAKKTQKEDILFPFSYLEICEISKNTFSYRTPTVAASEAHSKLWKIISLSYVHVHHSSTTALFLYRSNCTKELLKITILNFSQRHILHLVTAYLQPLLIFLIITSQWDILSVFSSESDLGLQTFS